MIELIIIVISILLDQGSKFLAVKHLKPVGSVPIIEDIFHLSYHENTGAAFSIFKDNASLLGMVSILASVLMISYLIHMKRKDPNRFSEIALAMIIGGAIGNGIDRLLHGYVVDFFDVRAINFAIFNVADSFITVGVILFALSLFLEEKRAQH